MQKLHAVMNQCKQEEPGQKPVRGRGLPSSRGHFLNKTSVRGRGDNPYFLTETNQIQEHISIKYQQHGGYHGENGNQEPTGRFYHQRLDHSQPISQNPNQSIGQQSPKSQLISQQSQHQSQYAYVYKPQAMKAGQQLGGSRGRGYRSD